MVADSSQRVFTRTAIIGGRDLGLEECQMREVVCALSNRNLFKSMTTQFDNTVWQDVYHTMTPVGVMAYVKVQIPFFMIKQSNDMISLIDGHDQRL